MNHTKTISLLMLSTILMLPVSIMSSDDTTPLLPSLRQMGSGVYQWTIGDLSALKVPRVVSVPAVGLPLGLVGGWIGIIGMFFGSTKVIDPCCNYMLGVLNTGYLSPSRHEKSVMKWFDDVMQLQVKDHEERIKRLEIQYQDAK